MCTIAVNIPEEVKYEMRMNKEATNQFVQQSVALRLYSQSGVSIGYCAQIAGMSEEEFIKLLSKKGMSIYHFDDEAEFMEEIANA